MEHHEGINPENSSAVMSETPAKAEVDDFLRKKRKAREHKACYPCRQRKVRCDLARPCRTCVEREHPELCDYHPPNKKQATGGSAGNVLPITPVVAKPDGGAGGGGGGGLALSHVQHANTVTLARTDFEHLCRKLDSVETTLEELRREIRTNNASASQRTPTQQSGRSSPGLHIAAGSDSNGQTRFENGFTRHTDVNGIHARNDLTGQTVHLGGSSVPALVMALGQGNREQPSVQEILGRSILPIFGLDNETATYPFVDLWGLAHGSLARVQELAKTIPTDSQCLSFFRYYRDLGNIIFPGVADLGQFESDLTMFLMARAERSTTLHSDNGNWPGVTENSIYEKNLQWAGLLFAVLASGCQCSGLPRKERELTSQVYSKMCWQGNLTDLLTFLPVCCSFECLRITNFLSHSTLENIQTLLILGNVSM